MKPDSSRSLAHDRHLWDKLRHKMRVVPQPARHALILIRSSYAPFDNRALRMSKAEMIGAYGVATPCPSFNSKC